MTLPYMYTTKNEHRHLPGTVGKATCTGDGGAAPPGLTGACLLFSFGNRKYSKYTTIRDSTTTNAQQVTNIQLT